MVASSSIESLRAALAPVEALRGEQSQLETWVRESFSAMDALHGELSDWQRDLTRQQALLDQREAGLQEASAGQESQAVAGLEQRLSEATEASRQLEDENAEQLQALEDLERQLAVVKAELRLATKHGDELNTALAHERERAGQEHRHWMAEFRELRRLLERQGDRLDRLANAGLDDYDSQVCPVGAEHEEVSEPCDESADDVASRSAELRRRANSRRVGQRRPS